jgi:hypothetical protein
MSLLWADPFDGVMQGLDKYPQFAGSYSSTYGRNGTGLQVLVSGTSGTVALERFPTASDEITVGAWHYVATGSPSPFQSDTVFALSTAVGSQLLKLTWREDQLRITDSGQNTVVSISGLVPRLTWHYIEWQLSRVNQSTEVRVNGATVYSNNSFGAAAGQLTRFWCERNRGHTYYLDDLYILNSTGTSFNDFLGPVRMEALAANADGSRSQLTPSTGTAHYSLINDGSDSTYVEGAATEGDLYDFANSSDSDDVIGALQYVRMFDSASAGITGRAICKPDATEHDGDDHTLGSTAATYAQAWPVNPDAATTSGWVLADLNATEFGVEFA